MIGILDRNPDNWPDDSQPDLQPTAGAGSGNDGPSTFLSRDPEQWERQESRQSDPDVVQQQQRATKKPIRQTAPIGWKYDESGKLVSAFRSNTIWIIGDRAALDERITEPRPSFLKQAGKGILTGASLGATTGIGAVIGAAAGGVIAGISRLYTGKNSVIARDALRQIIQDGLAEQGIRAREYRPARPYLVVDDTELNMEIWLMVVDGVQRALLANAQTEPERQLARAAATLRVESGPEHRHQMITILRGLQSTTWIEAAKSAEINPGSGAAEMRGGAIIAGAGLIALLTMGK